MHNGIHKWKAIYKNRYFLTDRNPYKLQYNMLYCISKALTGLCTITNIMMVFYFILYNKYNPYLPFYTIHTQYTFNVKTTKEKPENSVHVAAHRYIYVSIYILET